MKNLFIPYELALLAKINGYKEPTLYVFNENKELITNSWNGYFNDSLLKEVSAPLYQQIVDWFREKHNIILEVQYLGVYEGKDYFIGNIYADNIDETTDNQRYFYYDAFNDIIKDAFSMI